MAGAGADRGKSLALGGPIADTWRLCRADGSDDDASSFMNNWANVPVPTWDVGGAYAPSQASAPASQAEPYATANGGASQASSAGAGVPVWQLQVVAPALAYFCFNLHSACS